MSTPWRDYETLRSMPRPFLAPLLLPILSVVACAPMSGATHPDAPSGSSFRVRIAKSATPSDQFDAKLALASIEQDGTSEDLDESQDVTRNAGEVCLTVAIDSVVPDDAPKGTDAKREKEDIVCFEARPGLLYEVNGVRQQTGDVYIWVAEWPNYTEQRTVAEGTKAPSSEPTVDASSETAPPAATAE